MFWALFDQQGSRWTFQATRMDGSIGENFSFKPDQMQVINPLLILAFIPLYEVIFYPILSKIGIRRPLQKLTLGGILAGVAFVISALVEIQLEKTYPVIAGPGEAQIRIFNGLPCEVPFKTGIPNFPDLKIPPNEFYEYKALSVNGIKQFTATFGGCTELGLAEATGTYNLSSETATSIFIYNNNGIKIRPYEDDPSKSSNGFPLIRILANIPADKSFRLLDVRDDYNDQLSNINITSRDSLFNVAATTYVLEVDGKRVNEEFKLKLGGVYTLVLSEISSTYKQSLFIVSEPNSVHMLWLIPQFVVLTLGEVMYSVTGLEFSYSQAPPNMKSVLQGGWQLTVGVGNLIVAIVAEAKIFNSQTNEFFLFAGLMFVDMAIFAYMAMQYTYVDPDKVWAEHDEKNPIENNKNETVGIQSIPAILDGPGIDNAAFKSD